MKRSFGWLAVLLAVTLALPGAAFPLSARAAGSAAAASERAAEYADEEEFFDALIEAIEIRNDAFVDPEDTPEVNGPSIITLALIKEYEAVKEFEGAEFEDEELTRAARLNFEGRDAIITAFTDYADDEDIYLPMSLAGYLLYYQSLLIMQQNYGLELDEEEQETGEQFLSMFSEILSDMSGGSLGPGSGKDEREEGDGEAVFRNTSWGMSSDEVKELQEDEPVKEQEKNGRLNLTYESTIVDRDCYIEYSFIDDELCKVRITLNEEHMMADPYIEDYLAIEKQLAKKYGEPEVSGPVWSSDTYRRIYGSEIAMALMLGFVKYETVFDAQELGTSVRMLMKADNLQISTVIEYTSTEYGETELDYSDEL